LAAIAALATAAGRLSNPADTRLSIAFHPKLDGCEAQHIAIIRALRRVQLEYQDVEVVTVLPDARAALRGLLGEELPGRTVALDSRAYVAQGEVSPRPRLEVWSQSGQLLLLRSVPPSASEESIYQEVIWSRAFTGNAE
jgi:hypothetical protein